MSVLKYRRTESKVEYVNVANEIYTRTLAFLTRLSARYSRLMAERVSTLAAGVLDNAEMANSIYPSDERRIELREAHLLEARAALMALDVHLAHCYDVMMLNPESCFQTKSGKPVEKYNATRRLEGMAQTLGELIERENALLSGVIKQCKKSA